MSKILTICFSILILSISISAQSEANLCPAIRLTVPDTKIAPGESITFSVSFENEIPNLKYYWSVSAGTIVEGQETSSIIIATTPEMNGENVTAKIIIQGLPANCINEKSETKQIETIPIGCGLLDDYGKVSTAMEKAMLDSFFTFLFNNPDKIAFFRLERDKNETIEQTKKRIKKIMKHISFRKMDKNRFVFAVDKSETNSFGYLTSAILVPKNNPFPECKNCEIIKGEDIR